MTTAAAQARYPLTQGVNPWLVTVSVMLPTFMEILDTAIASVALPYIAGSLSASNSEATWVLTSYLVANAVILPASNWFARRFGRKRFLITCVTIFTVASFFCGAAPSLAGHCPRRRHRHRVTLAPGRTADRATAALPAGVWANLQSGAAGDSGLAFHRHAMRIQSFSPRRRTTHFSFAEN